MKNKSLKLKNILFLSIVTLFVFLIVLFTNFSVYAETKTIRVSDKIKIKVYPVTYYTETSSLGADYRNYLQSVYFFIPEEYNDRLITEITANWDYYRAKNIFISNDSNLNNSNISFLVHNNNYTSEGFESLDKFKSYLSSIGLHYNPDNLLKNGSDYTYKLNSYSTVKIGSNPFLYLKNTDHINLTLEEVLNIKNIKNSYTNHKAHYNQPIRNPEDNAIVLKSFDDNHNWFEKLLDFGFNMPIYEKNYTQHKFIEVVTDEKIKGSKKEISKRLGIQESQIDQFLNDYNNNKKLRCYLFRFGTGNIKVSSFSGTNGSYGGYSQTNLYVPYINKNGKYEAQSSKGIISGKICETDVYENFEIIELEMSKLIHQEIPEETITTEDPEAPGSTTEESNIKPGTEETHEVEQEDGPITITPGIQGETTNQTFLGQDWETMIENFNKEIKEFFNGLWKEFKTSKIFKALMITSFSLLGIILFVLLTKLIIFVLKIDRTKKINRIYKNRK